MARKYDTTNARYPGMFSFYPEIALIRVAYVTRIDASSASLG